MGVLEDFEKYINENIGQVVPPNSGLISKFIIAHHGKGYDTNSFAGLDFGPLCQRSDSVRLALTFGYFTGMNLTGTRFVGVNFKRTFEPFRDCITKDTSFEDCDLINAALTLEQIRASKDAWSQRGTFKPSGWKSTNGSSGERFTAGDYKDYLEICILEKNLSSTREDYLELDFVHF